LTGLALCLTLAAVLVAAIFGASAYESIVVSYSWRTRPEEAVGHYRALGAIVTPARYFRRLAPLSQLTLLVAVIWSAVAGVAVRWTSMALAAMVLADVITFTFHYPRNRALFIDPILHCQQHPSGRHADFGGAARPRGRSSRPAGVCPGAP
jgi:hypothetical protein